MRKIKKALNYKYTIIPIGIDGEEAYKAIIPKFPKMLIMADTPKGLHEMVTDVLEETIKELKKTGEPIPSPDTEPKVSGKILLRVKPQLHAQLLHEAQAHQMSLNKYIASKLEN